jgi:hypothetical protein
MTIESDTMTPVWTLQPRGSEETLHIPFGTAYLAMHFGGQAWDEVLAAASEHHLELPRDPDEER